MSAAVDFYTNPCDLMSPYDHPHPTNPKRRLVAVSVPWSPADREEDERSSARVMQFPVRSAASGAPLRITVRGKVILGLFVVMVGIGLLGLGHQSHSVEPVSAHQGQIISVQPGDTLWSIAQRVAPSSDPRIAVEKLVQVNHLASADLAPGQILQWR